MEELKDAAKMATIREAVLREFVQTSFSPIETNAGDGIVTIAMDARFQVTKVSLQDVDMDSQLLTRVEQAILKAVNDAFIEVSKRHSEKLIAAVERDIGK